MNKYYYVKISITVWPEIYDGEQIQYFPTEAAARLFAKNNLGETIPCIRVYSPKDQLLWRYGECPAEIT